MKLRQVCIVVVAAARSQNVFEARRLGASMADVGLPTRMVMALALPLPLVLILSIHCGSISTIVLLKFATIRLLNISKCSAKFLSRLQLSSPLSKLRVVNLRRARCRGCVMAGVGVLCAR